MTRAPGRLSAPAISRVVLSQALAAHDGSSLAIACTELPSGPRAFALVQALPSPGIALAELVATDLVALMRVGLSPAGAFACTGDDLPIEEGDAALHGVTAFAGLFDPERAVLRYGAAGEPAALVVGANGAHAQLSSTGPTLGTAASRRRTEGLARIAPGDALLLHSAGIATARALRALRSALDAGRDGAQAVVDAARNGGAAVVLATR